MINSAEQEAFYVPSGLGSESHQGLYHMIPTPNVYFYIALKYDRRYDRAAEGDTFATSMQDLKCHITTLWLWDSMRPLEKGSYGFVKHGSANPLDCSIYGNRPTGWFLIVYKKYVGLFPDSVDHERYHGKIDSVNRWIDPSSILLLLLLLLLLSLLYYYYFITITVIIIIITSKPSLE